MKAKAFYKIAVAVFAVSLGACAPTVSAEGYVAETPFQHYMRNLPGSYTGQRHVVLKPPSMASGPVYEYVPATPAMPAAAAPVVTTQSLAPPVYTAPVAAPTSGVVRGWTQLDSYNGTLPDAPSASAYTGGRIHLNPPARVTREVDYGDSITIYPLDSRDAAMPYIPPVYRPPTPMLTSTHNVPAGYNP